MWRDSLRGTRIRIDPHFDLAPSTRIRIQMETNADPQHFFSVTHSKKPMRIRNTFFQLYILRYTSAMYPPG
jgi:hypothetical protein